MEPHGLKRWQEILISIIAAALSSIVILFLSPVLLTRLLIEFSWYGLCGLQDLLSETLRRLKYGRKNVRNRAAQLPQELQLQVFAFLRSRAAFGRVERFLDEQADECAAAFGACRDLAVARLVCRAWTDAATEVLYADVTLVTARACIAFARTLVAHPRRALLVRRIALPFDSRSLTTAVPGPYGWEQTLYNGVRKMDLKAAVDRLTVQCSRATDVMFFRTPRIGTFEDVPGLMQCAPRLERLTVRYADGDDPPRATFSAGALAHFPRLHSLTLQRHRIVAAPGAGPPPLTALHTLRLGRCFLTLAALQALLGQLPGLGVLALRNTKVLDDMPLVPVAQLFAPAHAVLSEGTLIGRERLAVPRSLDFFLALRRLTLSACLLVGVQVLPPLLRELIVTTAPLPRERPTTLRWRRRTLFSVARCLLRLPTWSAPSLASVQLWDTVELPQLPDCYVVAYMLREALRPVGIAVAVNLFLSSLSEYGLRQQFRRRYRSRRLLWQDVI